MECGPLDQAIIFLLVLYVGTIMISFCVAMGAADHHHNSEIAERNTRKNIRIAVYGFAFWAAVSLIVAISSGIWGTCQ